MIIPKRLIPLDNFEIKIIFDSGETRILDIKPYKNGKVFAPLFTDMELFKSVKIDSLGGIEWDNGACLCRDTIIKVSY